MELKITCICPDLSKLEDNAITKLIEKHADSHIIVFPEYLLELAKEPKKSFPDQLIFFGSEIDLNFNKTKISLNGNFLSYNKQKLTPREKHLKAGSENICIHYKGIRIGLAVCCDIQFPELVAEWRKDDLDLLIVPAATQSAVGYEQLNRCASARAVELDCAVITCHLVGNASVGNHHMYLPDTRTNPLNLETTGEVIQNFTVPAL